MRSVYKHLVPTQAATGRIQYIHQLIVLFRLMHQPIIASYDITPNSFRLRWKAPEPTDNIAITGYEVRYRIVVIGTNSSQPYATAKTTGPETTIKITGLTPLNVYEVGVRALSPIGNSLWSQTYWTATAPPPPVITKTAIAMDRHYSQRTT